MKETIRKTWGASIIVFLFCFFTVHALDIQAQVVKQKSGTVFLTEGQSKKVQLKGTARKTVKNSKKRITIKSANKKIAKVSQSKAQKKSYSFTIKAIKKGTTTVTVKYKKNSVKLKVRVSKKKDGNQNKQPVQPGQTAVPTPEAPSVTAAPNPSASETPGQAEPTPRPLRVRITVPESNPETVGDYTKMTDLTTYSTNGKYEVNIWKDSKSNYYYNVVCDGLTVVEISPLGLVLSDTNLSTGLICDNKSSYVDEIYEEFETITLAAATSVNHCEERTIHFSNADGAYFDLLVRVYDDGFAYRYSNVTYGTGSSLICTEEESAIIFPEETTTWGGLSWINTCENNFDQKSYKRFVRDSAEYHPPLLANVEDYWILTSEAQIYNNNGEFCRSRLAKSANSNVLRWDFGDARDETVPLEEQAKKQNTTLDLANVDQKDITQIETVNGFSTPWRAMVISNDYDRFCTSTLITNLNPSPSESKYADLYKEKSWIKPGKVLWSWWSAGSRQGDYSLHKEYVDMAAEYGFEYICLDVGWRSFEDRLGELCDYAASKGVKIFCWINYWEMTTPEDMEALFSKWADAGAVGVKTDYFEGEEQQVLNVMENVAVIGAKYHFMVLYHGCIAPGGECRTYPNILTTEAVLGEENRIWGTNPTSKNCLMFPFTRNILGSMDYTPACMDISHNNGETEAFSLAKSVVYESGLLHLAAPAKDYRDHAALPFLQALYTTWDESFIPSNEAYPGEYITYVRRHGNEWFIGSMTQGERTMSVKLDFLESGKTYTASIYSSNEEGKLITEEKEVVAGEMLEISLKALDGVSVYIREKA